MLIKKTFAHAASPWVVNLAVAFVSGAPALSNVVSFVWANLAHGRARIGLVVGLQATFAVLVGLLGVAPRALGGLAFAVASILTARVIWTGILTVRAAVWSANYPRQAIGRYTGRIVIVSSLAVSIAAALAAWVLDKGRIDSRWLYGAGAVAGLVAAWLYRAARVRRQFALLAEETAAVGRTEPFSLGMLFEILKKGSAFPRIHVLDGLVRRRQPDADLAARGHLQRAPAPARQPADCAVVGRAARPVAAVRAVLGAHVRRGPRGRISARGRAGRWWRRWR